MMLDALKTIIRDFHQQPWPEKLVPRDLQVPHDAGKVVAVIGPRRAGKTWFLFSLLRRLEATVGRQRLVYINFEDERLPLATADLQLVLDAYQQLYPAVPIEEVRFCFDEIQVVPGWEQFVRRVHDTASRHLFLSGSSATLLGQEIASALRGRALTYNLLPFSFREFLRFHGVEKPDLHATATRNRLATLFDQFLAAGGYPETFGMDDGLRTRTLQSYVNVMIYRDIVERHDLGYPHLVKDLARRLLAQSGRVFSVHKYYRELRSRGVRVGKDLVYQYVDHFVDALFVLPVLKYDESPAKREQALKRLYVNDTGLVTACRFLTPADRGFLLETAVFLELAKRELPCCYDANHAECDLVVSEGERVVRAIQVCDTLTADNRTRELRGLRQTMKRFGLREGAIVSRTQEEMLAVDGGMVHVVPAWKWACTQADL